MGLLRVIGAIGKVAGGILPPPMGPISGAVGGLAHALNAHPGQMIVMPNTYGISVNSMALVNLADVAATRAQRREALVSAFLSDRIGTWLARSPGGETFSEWAYREEL